MEQLAAWEMHGLLQAGATEKELENHLRAMGFGKEDMERLRGLRLDPNIRWQT